MRHDIASAEYINRVEEVVISIETIHIDIRLAMQDIMETVPIIISLYAHICIWCSAYIQYMIGVTHKTTLSEEVKTTEKAVLCNNKVVISSRVIRLPQYDERKFRTVWDDARRVRIDKCRCVERVDG